MSITQKTLAALFVLSAALWLRNTPVPHIGTVTYNFDGAEKIETTHPFFIKAEHEYLNVELPMVLTRLQSTTLRIKPDDCLEELHINDVLVDHPLIPFCDYTHPGKEIDLAGYLKPGFNMWRMRIRDTGGDTGVMIAPALRGWVPIIDFSIVLAVVLYIASLRSSIRLLQKMKSMFPLLLGGIAVRITYVLATGYFLRGHDTDAHIDYIDYIVQNGSLPAPHAGWEFHQAPLYYIFSAIVHIVSDALGIASDSLYTIVQMESLLASIGIAVLGCVIALTLFPKTAQERSRYVFAAVIICSPALILLSSRITNNGLYAFVGTLTLWQMLRWWKNDTVKDWYALCALLAITALFKVSGLALVGAAGTAWILRHGRHRDMWRFAVIGGILFSLIFSWFPLSRLEHAEDANKLMKMGNVGMHSGLTLDNTLENFSTFSPGGILDKPYNNPWSDEHRRQYFWEYLFRSAFFGEFGFDDELRILAQGILLTGMLSLLLCGCGIIASFWKRDRYDTPLLLAMGFLLLAAFCYRYFFPYSANQDFRQSVLLLVPLAYFTVKGCDVLKRKISYSTVLLCCYCSLLFMTLLFWYR
jgi:hypothetical protein